MNYFVDVRTHAQFSAEKMKKNNLFTTERLFCDAYCFESGQEQAAHTHSGSDKVYYVIEGTARIQIGAEVREVGPGTAVLAPAEVPHAIRNATTGRLQVLVLMAPKP